MALEANRNDIVTELMGVSVVMMVMRSYMIALRTIQFRCARHSSESDALIYQRPGLCLLWVICRRLFVSADGNRASGLWIGSCPFLGSQGYLFPVFRIGIPFFPVPFFAVFIAAFFTLALSSHKSPEGNRKVVKSLCLTAPGAIFNHTPI